MATGRGILAGHRALQKENGGSNSISLGKPWATSIMQRMGFVKRKGTKAARKVSENVE